MHNTMRQSKTIFEAMLYLAGLFHGLIIYTHRWHLIKAATWRIKKLTAIRFLLKCDVSAFFPVITGDDLASKAEGFGREGHEFEFYHRRSTTTVVLS